MTPAGVADKASADAVNTLDHIARELHQLAALHAEGLGIPDEPFQGGVRDTVVRLLASPLVTHVCASR